MPCKSTPSASVDPTVHVSDAPLDSVIGPYARVSAHLGGSIHPFSRSPSGTCP